MIELAAGDVLATVSPDDGGRVASLTIRGTDVIVTGDPSQNPMLWGSYPMVPYAGRVAFGRYEFDGRTEQLPITMPPHAIHGSGYTSRWDVLDQGLDHAELSVALTWNHGGSAHQHIQLTPDALVCVLSVVADHVAMPVTLGWHPWFVKPVSDRLTFRSMYQRDSDGIPTGELVAPPPRPWDDCFVGPDLPLELRYGGDLTVTVDSDCDHWVVYDMPAHATCVEPQSGPPDAVNSGTATVIAPGEMLQRTMTIAWHW